MIQAQEYKQQFQDVVKGSNFMTPSVQGYYLTGDYICELSSGTDFAGNKLWGVTVVDTRNSTHDTDKGECFGSRSMALEYIKQLGRE